MDRRSFLQAAGLSVGASLWADTGCAPPISATPVTAANGPADLARWEDVRRQFDLRPDLIHLGGFFLASHPAPVRAAIEAHRKGLDESPFSYVEDNVGRFEAATRAALGAHVGARPEDFAMTDSATMGLGLVYGGLELRPEQEVLTSTHDHPSTVWSLRYRGARGAKVRTIQLYDRSELVSEDELVAKVVRELRPETRIVALTWVHSTSGVKLPVRRIADAVAVENRGRAEADRVILSVDGVHGFGVEDVTVGDLGCDVFIASGHKWLFGPRGTGFVWANAAGWSVVRPTIPTFDGMWRHGQRNELPTAAQMTPGGFHSFEHRWALGVAADFHRSIGKARIAGRIHELNRRAKEGLRALPHVRVYTPAADALSAGLVCFDVDGLSSKETVARLRGKNILASESPYAFKCARVSPGVLNTPEEIDTFLREVHALRA
jgi:selenocysteine lyase/cysteine desulfurase